MIEWNFDLFVFLLGLIIGSFLNVVILRLPKNQSIVFPRSHCPHCKKAVAAWDNIPVLSFILLRGRCRVCGERISWQYPVVELLTAILFLAVERKFGVSTELWLRHLPFVSILVIVTFIDFAHRIIPDEMSLGGSILGFLTSFLGSDPGWQGSLLGFSFGFGIFYLFAFTYFKVRRRSGLGGGDIKFLGMIGAFLGVSGVFVAILISSVLGSIIGLGWAYQQKKKNLFKASIPYGPFLVLGALCYYLLSDQLWLQFMIPM